MLQSYASPFTENMNVITHAFEGCPIRIADARYARTQAVGQLSAALRGVAQRTGVRFLDLARATEGREACNRSTSTRWIGLIEGSCLRGGAGALHAVAGVTAATAQAAPVS